MLILFHYKYLLWLNIVSLWTCLKMHGCWLQLTWPKYFTNEISLTNFRKVYMYVYRKGREGKKNSKRGDMGGGTNRLSILSIRLTVCPSLYKQGLTGWGAYIGKGRKGQTRIQDLAYTFYLTVFSNK